MRRSHGVCCAQGAADALQGTAQRPSLPAAAAECHKRQRGERLAADMGLLRDPASGQELCFEEVRLGQWRPITQARAQANAQSRVQPRAQPRAQQNSDIINGGRVSAPTAEAHMGVPAAAVAAAVPAASMRPLAGGLEKEEEQAAALETIAEVTEEMSAAGATPALRQLRQREVRHSGVEALSDLFLKKDWTVRSCMFRQKLEVNFSVAVNSAHP